MNLPRKRRFIWALIVIVPVISLLAFYFVFLRDTSVYSRDFGQYTIKIRIEHSDKVSRDYLVATYKRGYQLMWPSLIV